MSNDHDVIPRTAATGLERMAPAVVASLSALPPLFTLLYMSQSVAAYTAFLMSATGSGIAYLVGSRAEEAVRAGIAKVNSNVEALRSDVEWNEMVQEVRVEQLGSRLSPQQVEHVGNIVDQMLHTRDVEKERHLLALVQSVGGGPPVDDTRGKIIAEMARIGPTHIKALFEISNRTKFALRQARRDDPVNEEAARHMAVNQLGNFGGEVVVDALVAAGFTRLGSIEVRSTTPVRARASGYAQRSGTPEMMNIRYVEITALGKRTLELLGYRL